MTKPYENLNSIFEIEPALHAEVVDDEEGGIEPQKFGKEIVNRTSRDIELQSDYEYVRANMNSLISKGQDLISGAMELAEESESPRAYEVAINGIKSITEAAEKLIQLHEKMAKMEEAKGVAGTPTHATQNNIFINTTTADLIKSLKESAKNEKINKEETEKK